MASQYKWVIPASYAVVLSGWVASTAIAASPPGGALDLYLLPNETSVDIGAV